MAHSEKIAISLPGELVRKIENLRKETGESRSAFIRRAIQLAFREREKADLVKKYIKGYMKRPESEEEISAAEAAATNLLEEEPWE